MLYRPAYSGGGKGSETDLRCEFGDAADQRTLHAIAQEAIMVL